MRGMQTGRMKKKECRHASWAVYWLSLAGYLENRGHFRGQSPLIALGHPPIWSVLPLVSASATFFLAA